jgi:hypothetical protein
MQMHIEDLLKQLKTIEPDAHYALSSRSEILSHARTRRTGWRAVLVGVIQSGSAIALTGIMILLLGGAFSLRGFLARQGGFLDRQSLQAEAQAIDIQIQLANVSYENFTSAGNGALKPAAPKPVSHGSASSDATSTPPAATSTPDMNLDDALEMLSLP